MRFKRGVHLEHGLRHIDIAPLIDIVFQLLIFFMLTSSFVMQPGIRVNLPKAVASDVIEEQNIIIVLSVEGVIYIDEKVVTSQELMGYLSKAGNSARPILIKADKRTPLGRVVEVWDLCRQMGVERVNIATQQPSER